MKRMEKERVKTFRMVFLAMMVAIGVVISPILRIEGMCPTAHLINITCSVFMGPWYSLLCACMIGVIRMIDDDEIDDKIIAIPFEDPNWNYYHDIDQLPPHHGNEIAHFFEIYKSLEHKYTATSDALTRSVAVKVIKECIERYEVHYCGKCPSKEYESEKKRLKEEKKEAKEKEKLIKDIRKG